MAAETGLRQTEDDFENGRDEVTKGRLSRNGSSDFGLFLFASCFLFLPEKQFSLFLFLSHLVCYSVL